MKLEGKHVALFLAIAILMVAVVIGVSNTSRVGVSSLGEYNQADIYTNNVKLEEGTNVTITQSDAHNSLVISSTGGGGAGDITDVGDADTGAAFTADGPGTQLWFEGSTPDTWEVILTSDDPSGADFTATLSDHTGYLVVDVTECWDIEGEGLSIATGVLNMDINELTVEATPTSGDYFVIWDGSNHKKVDYDDLPGGSGGITAVGDVSGSVDAFTAASDGTTLWFEGSTSDEWEIILTSDDPSGADFTATLSDHSGYLVVDVTECWDIEGSGLTIDTGVLELGDLAEDWSVGGGFDVKFTLGGSDLWMMESAGGTFYGILQVGDLSTADKTYWFPNYSGEVIINSATQNLSNKTFITPVIVSANPSLKHSADDSYIEIYGGSTGQPGRLYLYGTTHATYPGEIYMTTKRAGATAAERFRLDAGADIVELWIQETEFILRDQTDASVGDQLVDTEEINLRAMYWNAASYDWDFEIYHDMQTAGATPKSQVPFTINAVSLLTLENDNGTATVFLDANTETSGAFDVILNDANSELHILESAGDTYYGIFDVADLSSSDKTYTFPDATSYIVVDTSSVVTDVEGEGLSVTANVLNLDLNELAAEASPTSGDYFVIWDGSAHKKVDYDDLPGGGAGITDVGDVSGANPAFTADGGGTTLWFEGGTSDEWEVILTSDDPSGADFTATLSDHTGYLIVDVTECWDIEGSGLGIDTGVLELAALGENWTPGSSYDIVTPNFGTSVILSQSTADYTVVWSDPASARQVTLGDPGGNAYFVTDATQVTDVEGEGLSITSNVLNLNINELSEEVSPTSGDIFVIWDGSAHKKVDYDNLPGGGGGVTAVGDVSGSVDAFTAASDGTTLWFEGSTSDEWEIILTSDDPSGADFTATLSDHTGYLIVDATECWDLEGTGLSITTGTLNVATATLTTLGIAKFDSVGQDDFNISAGDVTLKDTSYTIVLVAGSVVTDSTMPAGVAKVDGSNFCYYVADFHPDNVEIVYWEFVIPDTYNGNNITPTLHWISTATTGDVDWDMKVLGRTDAEVYDAAMPSAQNVKTTTDGTAGAINTSTFSAFSPGWAAGDLVIVMLYRDADDGVNDTMTADARLIDVVISWPSTR